MSKRLAMPFCNAFSTFFAGSGPFTMALYPMLTRAGLLPTWQAICPEEDERSRLRQNGMATSTKSVKMKHSIIKPGILTGFKPEHSELWGHHPVKIEHSLEQSGLFSDEALARLIEGYPRKKYDFNHMNAQGSDRRGWVEGELGDCRGEHALEAVREGRMWLNLRFVNEVDPRYGELLADIFKELAELVPDMRDTFRHKMGILISSPGAQVYYHTDIPGQGLWQLRGSKRVYVYPNYAPFLTEEGLTNVITGAGNDDIRYETWFDDYAHVVDLEPGEMVHWPLNAPHRVENHDVLNVSVTTEHWTTDIRRYYAVRYANGFLNRTLGMKLPEARIKGPAFYPKAALAVAGKKLLPRGAVNKRTYMVEFKLGPKSDNYMTPITPYAR